MAKRNANVKTNVKEKTNEAARKSTSPTLIKIHTFNDLDEVFFKRLISIIKNGIDNCKIHPPKSNHSHSSMITQSELHNWIKNDEEGCLSTIQKYLQKENLVLIVDQDDPQLEQAFLDTLFDAVWYLATSTKTGVLG